MARRNPTRAQHQRLVGELFESAINELDLAYGAFVRGDFPTGWTHYLDALAEIARAQQEIVHASSGAADEDALDLLDELNVMISTHDAMIRQALLERLGGRLPLHAMFDTERAATDGGPTLEVQIAPWETMHQSIAEQLLARYGSLAKASEAIGVPRSTFATWVRGRRRPSPRGAQRRRVA